MDWFLYSPFLLCLSTQSPLYNFPHSPIHTSTWKCFQANIHRHSFSIRCIWEQLEVSILPKDSGEVEAMAKCGKRSTTMGFIILKTILKEVGIHEWTNSSTLTKQHGFFQVAYSLGLCRPISNHSLFPLPYCYHVSYHCSPLQNPKAFKPSDLHTATLEFISISIFV